MGITGLLPFVKNAVRQGNIRELSNKSVAVDVSCLLHRGLTGCMDKLHMGESTKSYVYYVEKYINDLISLNCHVVMVFDGRPLPAKKGTNDGRRETRDKNVEHAELLLAKGLEKQAREKFRLATKISTEIVNTTISHFRAWKNVDVLVAPYEADAQLAYLMKSKLVDAVITEDSDLIVFGCETIYFKWQCGTGECSVYEKEKLKECFTGEMGGSKFDFVKFRRICILAGCDYLQAGLPGVGLSTATKFFQKTSLNDLNILLRKIPSYLNNLKLKSHITNEFIENFIRAENTFMFQIVFDPKERCQRPLNPYPSMGITESAENFNYAGSVCNQKLAVRLALGNKVDDASINDKFLLPSLLPLWSIWSQRYESKGSIQIQIEKEKMETATQCGGAFRLDPPNVKRVKKVEDRKKLSRGGDDDDDLIKQFMDDVQRTEKRKKRNAPDDDYCAESMLMKYSAKKQKQEEDTVFFDEIIEAIEQKEKTTNEENDGKIETSKESTKLVSSSVTFKSESTTSVKEEKSVSSPPIVRKSVSSPANPIRVLKKFQSPILTSRNSSPSSLTQSKYFMNKGKISNPFRCPAFIKPEKKPEEIKINENADSILGQLDDGQSTERPSDTSSFRFVGLKVSGLRRKSNML